MLKYVLLDEIKLQIGWNWVLPVDSSAANFKPNCVQSPVLWIQNLNYHDSLHWKINRKSQLDSGIKRQLLTTKNKISSFFSHKLLKCFKQRWNAWRYRKRELQEPRHRVSSRRPDHIPQVTPYLLRTCHAASPFILEVEFMLMAYKSVVTTNIPFSIFQSFHLAAKFAFGKMTMIIKCDHSTLRGFMFPWVVQRWWVGYRFTVLQRELKLNLARNESRLQRQLLPLFLKMVKLIFKNIFIVKTKKISRQWYFA